MGRTPERRLIIVTGLSGAGKSVALRALEDSGYFCVDNFPFPLLKDLLKLTRKDKQTRHLAIGVDIRERAFLTNIQSDVKDLKRRFHAQILFLEADSDVLLRRYKETRRPHPLQDSEGNLQKALEAERQMLQALREMADLIVDTSSFSPHQLRQYVMQRFCGKGPSFGITLLSFGYKYGIPPNVDLLFDIRFLRNPHFVETLRPLTGLDEPVREVVLKAPLTEEMLMRLKDLLGFLIPLYQREGKSNLTIGIGCTGGRHRSPVIVEVLKGFIAEEFKVPVHTLHREL